MDSWWTVGGQSWTVGGQLMGSRWTFGGQLVDSRWTVGGQSVDSRWTVGGQSAEPQMTQIILWPMDFSDGELYLASGVQRWPPRAEYLWTSSRPLCNAQGANVAWQVRAQTRIRPFWRFQDTRRTHAQHLHDVAS